MAVSYPLSNILENVLGLILSELLILLDEVIEVTSSCVLHHHHYVLLVFEDLVEPDDVGMSNFLENIHLLEDLLARVLVFQLAQLNHLYGHELAGELLDGQVHLSESPVSNFLDEFVEVQARRRELMVLSHVLAIVLYDFLTLFHDFIVQLLMLATIEVLLPLVY